jgi:hypothetical protein
MQQSTREHLPFLLLLEGWSFCFVLVRLHCGANVKGVSEEKTYPPWSHLQVYATSPLVPAFAALAAGRLGLVQGPLLWNLMIRKADPALGSSLDRAPGTCNQTRASSAQPLLVHYPLNRYLLDPSLGGCIACRGCLPSVMATMVTAFSPVDPLPGKFLFFLG